jgi:hypothetical protein
VFDKWYNVREVFGKKAIKNANKKSIIIAPDTIKV